MVADPAETGFDLPAGTFRALDWAATGATGPTALLLHGLSGVADVWCDTVAALGESRPRCVAVDQRGHGHSPATPGRYRVGDHVGDVRTLVGRLGAPVHLVGHSMGARVAFVTAARHPELAASVVVVDIGPEAWAANIDRTTRMFRSMPTRFADRAEALEFGQLYGSGPGAAERFVEQRLRPQPDGTFTWLASADGLVETVSAHRRRNFWAEWDALAVPTLLVRGGTSGELRPRTFEQMRRRNPRVEVAELDGVGHNVPLLAPQRLAVEIRAFWSRLPLDGDLDVDQRQ